NNEDQDSDNNGDDFVDPKLSTHDEEAKDEESFDPIVQTPSQVENSNDKSNDDERHGMNVEEMKDRMQKMMMKNCIDSLFESTPRVDVPVTTAVVPLLVTAPTLPPPSIPIMSQEKASKTTGKPTEGSKSHQKTASESAPAAEPIQTTQDLEEPSHQEFKTGAADDQPVADASHHPEGFSKQKNLQLMIVLGTRLCQLLTEAFNLG
nr:hypothetical protein [Tanacetum cinerariifolium]